MRGWPPARHPQVFHNFQPLPTYVKYDKEIGKKENRTESD